MEALKKVYEQEDKDHEVSMARGELEAIADKATQLASALQGKSDEGNPLEAWVQSKITKAKDYINSVSDYLMYNPDMAKEETILEKSFTSQQIKQAYGILNDPRYKSGNYDGAVKAIEKLAKGLSDHPDVKNALKRANEEVDLDEGKIKDIFTANQEGESIDNIAKRLKMSAKDVRKILGEEVLDEKVADSIIKDLQKAYAPLKGKTISPEMANKMSKHLDGQSFDVVTLRQLMKAQIPFISTLARNKIYKKTGKFEELEEAFTLDQITKAKTLAKYYANDMTSAVKNIEKLAKGLSKHPTVANVLKKANESVNEANIDVDNVDKKDSSKEKELKIKLDKEKDTDAIEKQLIAAQGQINILKQKLENEKNRAIKPEPNPETGEVPLTVGIAHKLIKDKQNKEMKKEEVDNYPTSDINKKKHASYKDPKSGERKPVYTHEGAKLVYETIKGLKNKAEKSGMPYSILKKVYDRGMAAWRGGHRPGTTQQQWAFARVNSFVTKSSGTWGGADKDLAKQVRGKN